jgi:hypothetical protein
LLKGLVGKQYEQMRNETLFSTLKKKTRACDNPPALLKGLVGAALVCHLEFAYCRYPLPQGSGQEPSRTHQPCSRVWWGKKHTTMPALDLQNDHQGFKISALNRLDEQGQNQTDGDRLTDLVD